MTQDSLPQESPQAGPCLFGLLGLFGIFGPFGLLLQEFTFRLSLFCSPGVAGRASYLTWFPSVGIAGAAGCLTLLSYIGLTGDAGRLQG